MNVREQLNPLTLTRRTANLPVAAAMGRFRQQMEKAEKNAGPGRWAVRFFAAMLVLTLIARGFSGAAMPRVSLTKPVQGTILQQASAAAVITAGEGEDLSIPQGITVETLYVSSGQTVQEGDPLVQLDLEELQEALDRAQVTQAQQQAQLAQLNAATPADDSSVSSAQQSLDRAQEDYTRAEEESRRAVDQAKSNQEQAEQAYDSALKRWEELDQSDPAVTQEMVEAACQTVEAAKSALTAAQQQVLNAQNSREDTLLSAKRSLENAQTALDQANNAYAQAQESAALTAQTNAAQAEGIALDLETTGETIQLLESLVKAEGLVVAPRDSQVLECSLEEGQLSPQKNSLRLSREGSQLLTQFSLPQDQAEKILPGQEVTVTQGSASALATVRRVEDTDGETSQVTAVLPQESVGFKAGSAQASVVFSRTQYGACVPVSAIRQDTQGNYVLTVEETKTAFGIQYQALRVPVTVLEVDSDGQYAAVEGNIQGGVITSSTGTVSPGSSVRYEA